MSVRADDAKNDAFDRVLLADSCESSDCAIAENARGQLNVNFTYGDMKSYVSCVEYYQLDIYLGKLHVGLRENMGKL